jgi:hypothetical protein
MPPADIADGGRAGNKSSISQQYLPCFTAVVTLPAKIDSSSSVCRLPVAVVNLHEVPVGELMIKAKVPDGLEGCTFSAPDPFVLPRCSPASDRPGVCDSNVEFVIFFVFTCSLLKTATCNELFDFYSTNRGHVKIMLHLYEMPVPYSSTYIPEKTAPQKKN